MKRLVSIIIILITLFVLFSLFELKHIYFALALLGVLIVLGIHDFFQRKHSILRNFPVIGHARFLLEAIRPEIQQYFIANNQSERPFNRETRTLIYQRAKGVSDTIPFGTQLNIDRPGFESIRHSLHPTEISEKESRVTIGGSECKQPYNASRLNISAMSFGAISQNAVMALNNGARIGGFAHNTGEGGLTPHHLAGGGDIIMQLGTAYFGCRTEKGEFCKEKFIEKSHQPQVKMIEIKLSQGAKPSHGGVLPAAKITPEISEIRGVPMGKDCLSSPVHSAFSTPIGLLKFIVHLRELSGGKPVGFKMAIGKRCEFFSICKAMLQTGILPDFITVDGAEGGTGAAPVEFSNYLGEPINDALIFVNNALNGIGVRDKLHVIGSGKVATGLDVITKLALGADLCNSARAMMFALGCIQSLQCNTNSCPTGVATQNPRLYRGLVVKDKAQRVANFHNVTMKSCLELAGAMGTKHLSELSPADIYHRLDFARSESYAQLYTILSSGDLLDKTTIPLHYLQDWEMAQAETF